ncbi:tape measure protein [Acinetobacter sp. TYF_19]|uniref:tape measure protein n=1 Tax=Acinetobacter sp. TYF_19 TaxID=3367196 RepID=UPI00370CDCB8
MSGKNLTFKLIMDGDSKGLVAAAKQSKDVSKKLFETIEGEAERLKQTSAETAKEIGKIIPTDLPKKAEQVKGELGELGGELQDVANTAKNTGAEIGNIIPKNASERAATLIKSLNEITEIIKSTGTSVVGTSDSFEKFGVDSVRSLNLLKANLATAKTKLEEFSKTKATPEDIRIAQQQIDALEKEVQQADLAFGAFKSELSLITPEVAKLDTELGKTNVELQKNETFAKQASGEIQGLKTGYTALTSAMAALGIGASATEIARTADEFKVLEARIGLVTSKSGNFTQAFEGVKKIAIETRSNLTATAELFTRVKTATDQLGYSQERALNLTDLVNKSIIVGGGLAASNEAAIYQFNQALQSGVLRGEEFNSVMEQAPRLARALADGLGVNIGKLREMANTGQLTSSVIVKALESQSKALNDEFSKMPITIGQSIENLKTAWTLYIGEADAANGASTKVAEAIKFVAENLEVLVSTLTTVAQAYVAYKALGIAASFLEKANAVKIAQAAIATETASIVTNTQAQLVNTRATQAAIVAKNQLTVATNASNTANVAASGVIGRVSTAANGLKGSIAGVLSRFGAYGVAAAGVILASDLIVDGFKKTDEWLLKQGSDFIDWAVSRATGTKSLVDQEKEFIAAEEASRKKQEEVAAVKAKNAERTEMLKNASLGLNEASKATVVEFEKLVKEGAKVSDVLGQIAKSFNFSTTTGINDGLTALLALQTQGKATAEEIRKALTGILSDEDLVAFEGRLAAIPVNIEKQLEATNAKIKAKQLELDAWKRANRDMEYQAWLKEVGKFQGDISKLQAEASTLNVQYANSVKSAAMVQGAVLDEAIRRTGLSYVELKGESTEAFTKANNDVRVLIQGLDELKGQGVDVGRALNASISTAINTATNQQELDALKLKIESLRSDLGAQVANGLLQQAEQQLLEIKNKADQARAGINSVNEAFSVFGIQSKEQAGQQATVYQEAYQEMVKSGEATAGQMRQALQKMSADIYASGNAAKIAWYEAQLGLQGMVAQIDEFGNASASLQKTDQAIQQIGQSALTSAKQISVMNGQAGSESSDSLAGQDYWEAFKAKKQASVDALNTRSKGVSSNTGGMTSITNSPEMTAIAAPMTEMPPMVATGFDIQMDESMGPKETKRLELVSGGKSASLEGTPEAVDSVEEMLQKFETLKRSM